MKNHYSHFTKDLSTKFEFEGSEITLNTPEDGVLTEEGWKVTPITPTVVCSCTISTVLVISDSGAVINCAVLALPSVHLCRLLRGKQMSLRKDS